MQSSSGCKKVNDGINYREMQTRSRKSQFFERELFYTNRYAYCSQKLSSYQLFFLMALTTGSGTIQSLLNQTCLAGGRPSCR
jgi:hypothetical protein